MNSDKFILGAEQSHELETAIRRNAGDTTDVQWLCAGENFASVKRLARGQAKLTAVAVPPQIADTRPPLEIEILKIGDCAERIVGGKLARLLPHSVVVDYDLSFTVLVNLAHCHVRDGISAASFESRYGTGRQVRSFEIVMFPKSPVYKETVFHELADLGLRAADITEQLSLAPKLRSSRKPLTILALNSVTTTTKTVKEKRWFGFQKKDREIAEPNRHPLLECNGQGGSLLRLTSSDNQSGWWNHVLILALHV